MFINKHKNRLNHEIHFIAQGKICISRYAFYFYTKIKSVA